MLSSFRAFAKSWVAKALLGVIALGFVGFGVNQGFVGPRISTDVISAGDRHVSASEFHQTLQRELSDPQTGQTMTMADAVKQHIPELLANNLAPRQAFFAWTDRAGILPDASLTSDHLHDIPILRGAFNPVTGVFDKSKFLQILGALKQDEQSFMRDVHDDVTVNHFENAVKAGVRTPRIYAALMAQYRLETRDASFAVLDPRAVPPPPAPTDADLQGLYNSLGERLRTPERRRLSVVVFDPALVMADVKVDPAEVKRVFDLRKDSMSIAEKRSFTEVATRDAASAGRAAELLRAGASAEAAAKASGGQVLSANDKSKASIPDPKVAEAVFSLRSGETSGPIQGELSFAAVRVIAVTPGHAASLSEAAPQIEQDLRTQGAKAKVAEMTQQYEDARLAGASLLDAAHKVGAKVTALAPIDKTGHQADGVQRNIPKVVIDEAFSLPKGDGDLKSLQGGVSFAVRVEDITPSALPRFADIRDKLAQAWTAQQASKALKAKADSMVARMTKGQSLEAVAAAEHAEVKHALAVPRPQQVNSLQTQLQASLFAQKQGAPFSLPIGPTVMVGVVTAVHAPDVQRAAQATEGLRPGLQNELINSLLQSAQVSARDLIKPTVDQQNLAKAAQ